MLDEIKDLIKEPLSNEKIEVLDVFFEEEDGVKNLIINPILDEADLIEESYVLNVCSKGVDE